MDIFGKISSGVLRVKVLIGLALVLHVYSWPSGYGYHCSEGEDGRFVIYDTCLGEEYARGITVESLGHFYPDSSSWFKLPHDQNRIQGTVVSRVTCLTILERTPQPLVGPDTLYDLALEAVPHTNQYRRVGIIAEFDARTRELQGRRGSLRHWFASCKMQTIEVV